MEEPYYSLEGGTPREVSRFSLRKIMTLILGLTSIGSLVTFKDKNSHTFLAGNVPESNNSKISLTKLNDLIRQGVLIHSFSWREYGETFGTTAATRKMLRAPHGELLPTINFGYFNLKSMTFAKGDLPYAPNFGAFVKFDFMNKGQFDIPQSPNIVMIVEPNDEDVEIATWRNFDIINPDVEQNGIPLTMDRKCDAVSSQVSSNMQDPVASRLHVNQKFRTECKNALLNGLKDEETFETFNGSEIDPESYNSRGGYKKLLSQHGTFSQGLNLVNFFAPLDMFFVHTGSIWNEVDASFPPRSVKAIVYENTEQGQKDAERLQKLIPGHPPLFPFSTSISGLDLQHINHGITQK